MSSKIDRREFLKAGASLAAGMAALSLGEKLAWAAGASRPATGPAAMPKRVLGKTGLKVSILGLGGVGLTSKSTDKDAVAELLNEAVDSGINFFDTAYNYGHEGLCDKNFGLIMGTPRRKEVFLAAKVEDRTYDGAMRQAETSLKRLRTDYVDLMQVHYVNKADDVKAFGRKNGVLTALRRLRDQKVVRHIGVTGHPQFPQVAEALKTYDWETFMCFINPARFSRNAFKTQLPVARKKKMGVIAMKTLGGSPGMLVGEGKGKAPASMLLRYAWDQPIAVNIPGVDSLRQLRENVELARSYKPLSAVEREALVARINAPAKGWYE